LIKRYWLILITLITVIAASALNSRSVAYWYYFEKAFSHYREAVTLLAKNYKNEQKPDNAAIARHELKLALKYSKKANTFATKTHYPLLLSGLISTFNDESQKAHTYFNKFLSLHKTGFAIPLKAIQTYKGTPDYDPFSEIYVQEVPISPQSAIMSGWVAFHRRDLDLTRNFLIRARSAANLAPSYHYLLALTQIEAGDYSKGLTNLKQARTLSSSRNSIKNFGVDIDTFPITFIVQGSKVTIERGKWIGKFIPYGMKNHRTSAEILYGIAVLNNLNKNYHRSVFITEIIKMNTSYKIYKDQMPQLDQLAYPLGFHALIKNNCKELGLDPYLILALIREESKFKTGVKSNKAAQGLMQIIPETARWLCLKTRRTYRDGMLATPSINIALGCWYMNYLLNKFAYKPTREKWALAAYNAGLGNAQRWMKRWNKKGRKGSVIDYIRYKETKDYVVRVTKNYHHYKKLYEPTDTN